MSAVCADVRGDALHRELLAELSRAGCLRPAYLRAALHGAAVLACYAAGYAVLLAEPAPAARLAAVVVLAFVTVRAAFIAHEAGHGALVRDRRGVALIGQVFHTFLTGLSYRYFQHIHRIHHPHCNDRGRDPDMQSEVLAMYPESARAKRGLGRLVSRRQARLIWLLIGLQGFTLRIDGLAYLWRNRRRTRVDQVLAAAHFALWLAAPAMAIGFAQAAVNYVLVTVLVGFYVGGMFVVNHIGTRVIEPGERISYFRQELAVTRNLGDSRIDDFVFGGLNNHIEHHLFPAIPTARLRAARRITREFCARRGIPYREMSWLAAAREVSGHLGAMSALVP